MPLRAPQPPPQTQRDWDQWTRTVPIVPDDGSVSTVTVADKAVTNAKLRDSAPASVIGRLQSTPGQPADIVASADDTFLARRGGVLTYTTLADADIPTAIARDAEVTAGDAAVTVGYIAADAALVASKFLTGTYTGAFTGCTTDPAPTLRYSVSGSIVVLYFPSTTATSNATSFTITGAPSAIRPARSQAVICRVTDNGTASFGVTTMDTGGVMTFGLGATGGVFTNTGTKGTPSHSITYSLD